MWAGSDILKAVVLSPITSWVVLLAGVSLFYFTRDKQAHELVAEIWLSIGLAGVLVHAAVWIKHKSVLAWRWRSYRERVRLASQPRPQLIEQLSREELAAINPFYYILNTKPNVRVCDRHDPVIKSLVKKGVLIEVAGDGSTALDGAFQIRHWAYEHPHRGTINDRMEAEFGHPLGGRTVGK